MIHSATATLMTQPAPISTALPSSTGGISAASPLPARAGRPRTLDERFDFGLERVLDGIQHHMDSLPAIIGKT
jgi:hypothetical protein